MQTWRAAEVPGSIMVSKNWLCTYAKLEIGWQNQFADPQLAWISHERQGPKPMGLTPASSNATCSIQQAKTHFKINSESLSGIMSRPGKTLPKSLVPFPVSWGRDCVESCMSQSFEIFLQWSRSFHQRTQVISFASCIEKAALVFTEESKNSTDKSPSVFPFLGNRQTTWWFWCKKN